MNWANVNIEEKFVEVPDIASKTGIRRIVDMDPVLVLWINYYRSRGGRMKGSLVPKTNLRKRLRVIRAAAGIERWPQDAPRRTFASCWLAAYSDVNRLNNLMGHTSPATLWKHYHKAVTTRSALEFWRIGPPTSRKAKRIASNNAATYVADDPGSRASHVALSRKARALRLSRMDRATAAEAADAAATMSDIVAEEDRKHRGK